MDIPAVLMDWKLALMLVIGSVSFLNGIRIWIRGYTTVGDPFLWGPLTAWIGCFTADYFFEDDEIRGIPARVLAVFQTLFGLAFLTLFFFLGVWPAYFSKAPGSLDAADPVSEVRTMPQAPLSTPPPATPVRSGTIEHGAKASLPEGMQRR